MTGMPHLPAHGHQRGGTGPDGGRHGTDGGPHGTDGGPHGTDGGRHGTDGGRHGTDGGRHGTDGGRHGADGHVELAGDPGRPRAWTLLAGGAAQSHVDLDDPRHLELEYMRRFAHLIDLAVPAGMPLRVLHLGGGGLTLARYVAATRPGSNQLAVESEPEVARLVRRRLPLARPGGRRPGTGRIIVRVADARAALEQVPPGSFD